MSNAQKLSQAVAGGADPVKTGVAQTWTAQQTFNGSVGIGASPITGFKLSNHGNVSGATTAYSYYSGSVFQSDVTTSAIGYGTFLDVQDTTFTLSSLSHHRASSATFGSATVTNQFGFEATSNLTGATNNYGFFSSIASGTGRYNFYANGTADNYFGGTTYIQPPGVNPTYGSALTPSVAWSKLSWSAESTTSSATYTGLTIGQLYQIDWSTTSGSYAFNVTLDGSVTLANVQWWGNKSVTFTATATSHIVNLVPTGAITAVITTPTVKSVATKGGAVAIGIKDAEGSAASQMRSFNDTLTCTAIGTYALTSNTTGYGNSAFGSGALQLNTTGFNNSAIGLSALYANTTGYNNSAFGLSALYANTTGYGNSAFGSGALQLNTTGFNNSAIGLSALYANTTGYSNSAIGVSALQANTTGNYNSAIGLSALYANTTGYGNSAIGASALQSNTTGFSNSAIGSSAGRYYGAGTSAATTCNSSVYLGYDTRASADGNTNEIVIGASAIGNGSNTTTIGNSSVTSTVIPAGNLILSSGQIKFPATQNASADANTLDDYEEGDFTPTIVGTSTAGTGTYSSQVGKYTKVGRKVTFQLYVQWSAHTGTGNMRVSGLPFTADSTATNYAAFSSWNSGVAMTAGNVMQANVNPGGVQVVLEQVPTGGGSSVAIPIDTASSIMVQGSYIS